ncbi:MAG: hypothetical protein RL077_4486 [Verrucomicrobiota bacterium]|jgi:hypothetical protein
MGIPAVAVANPGFDAQVKKVGRAGGIPDVQVALYPDPFDLDTDAQLREKSARIVLPQIIEALTKPVSVSAESTSVRDNKAIEFTGTLDQINRYVTDKGWSDGMSITPPTIEKVEEFLKYTGYAPHEEIAVLPLANLRATPWNIAVNAVMAGCRPEYMPVLIAAVQAMGDPNFRYRNHGGSTHSFVSFFWINGPLVRQLGIDHGQGLIANPVNAVMGRAMSLIERNIAGFKIKESQMGSFGKQMMYVLAEDEEAMVELGRGWEPYQVEKGFGRNANTVSAGYSTAMGRNLIPATSDPKTLVQLMAYGLVNNEAFASGFTGESRRYVLIEPGVAKILVQGGYTKESLRQELITNGRKITHEAIFSQVHGSYGNVQGTFEAELAKATRNPENEKGKLPLWYGRFPGWEQIQTTPAVKMVEIIVCGDPARNKVQNLAGGAGVAIKEIKLPPRWNQLMARLGRPPLEDFHLKAGAMSDAKTDEKAKVSAATTDEKPKVTANEADRSAAAKTSIKSSEDAKSLVGDWKWSQQSAAGGSPVERRFKLTLNNGKLEGTVFGGQFGQFKVADAEIASAEFKGGRITFVTGNERTTKYEGVVEGDSIKGTIDGTGRDGRPLKREWNATRAP